MDILFGILVVVAAILVIAFILARKAVTRGVDPTQLTFDPSVMADVQELARAGRKVQAIALLRQATPNLSVMAASAIVERLATRSPRTPSEAVADLPDVPLVALPSEWSDDAPSASAVPFEIELEVRNLKAQGREQDAVALLHSDAGFDVEEAQDFVRGL